MADVVHGGEQVGVRIGLQNVGEGAETEAFPRDFLREMHGEHQDVGRGGFVADGADNIEAAHFRHGQVEDEQVRLFLLDVVHGLDAIGGFATYLDAGLGFQHGADAAADNDMVVGDQNAIGLGDVHGLGSLLYGR